MSVAETVAHVGDTLLWYAADVAAGLSELSTMELRVRPEMPPAGLPATVCRPTRPCRPPSSP